jgi:hypothetical protein
MSKDRIDPGSSIVYMALSVLCMSQDSLVPEILYMLSPEQVINFIRVFGGETLRIPTSEEFNKDLMVALACYHVVVQEKSWDWIALQYNMDGNSVRGLKVRTENWFNKLSPGEQDFVLSLKNHEKARNRQEEV